MTRHQNCWVRMHAHDPEFEAHNALEGAFDTAFMYRIVILIRHHWISAYKFGLELDWTFENTRRRDYFRGNRREPSGRELVYFILIPAKPLPRRHGIRTGCH